MRIACLSLLFIIAGIQLAEADPGLPEKVIKQINSELGDSFVMNCYLTPCFLKGDFNGDGSSDYAVLVIKKVDMKRGIAFLHKDRNPMVVGAGSPIGAGGDDFEWADEWSLYKKGPVQDGATETPAPRLQGDGVIIGKTMSASGLLYWDGKAYAWYQQGD